MKKLKETSRPEWNLNDKTTKSYFSTTLPLRSRENNPTPKEYSKREKKDTHIQRSLSTQSKTSLQPLSKNQRKTPETKLKKKDVMIDALDLFDACNDNVLPEESPELNVKEEEESEAFNEISSNFSTMARPVLIPLTLGPLKRIQGALKKTELPSRNQNHRASALENQKKLKGLHHSEKSSEKKIISTPFKLKKKKIVQDTKKMKKEGSLHDLKEEHREALRFLEELSLDKIGDGS